MPEKEWQIKVKPQRELNIVSQIEKQVKIREAESFHLFFSCRKCEN